MSHRLREAVHKQAARQSTQKERCDARMAAGVESPAAPAELPHHLHDFVICYPGTYHQARISTMALYPCRALALASTSRSHRFVSTLDSTVCKSMIRLLFLLCKRA